MDHMQEDYAADDDGGGAFFSDHQMDFTWNANEIGSGVKEETAASGGWLPLPAGLPEDPEDKKAGREDAEDETKSDLVCKVETKVEEGGALTGNSTCH